jgi:hypothetical protein
LKMLLIVWHSMTGGSRQMVRITRLPSIADV